MTDTLFRFVTVRNPRKLTKPERSARFISYKPEIDAPLVGRVLELIQRMKEAEQYDHMQFLSTTSKLVSTAEAQSVVFDSVEEMLASAAHLDHWVEFLEAHAGKPTVEATQAMLPHHDLKISKESLQKLWDTLLAATYSGKRQSLRESVIWALRAVRVRELADDESLTQEALNSAANATVVLPYRLPQEFIGFEAPEEIEEEQAETHPDAADIKEREKALKEIREIESAVVELEQLHDQELKLERYVHPPEPIVPEANCEPPEPQRKDDPGFVIGKRTLRSLSENARHVVENYNLSSDVPLPIAISRLEQVGQALSQRDAARNRATIRVHYTGGAMWTQEKIKRTHHQHPRKPKTPPGRRDDDYDGMYMEPRCRIKPLGVADFRRVEQTLHCYGAGEVAHIENVMQGESKLRETRRLERSEDTLTIAEENETTEERDTQTTDRYEMERESSKVIEKSLEFELGVSVAGSYGPVKVEVNSKLATSNSTVESAKSATTYAKEVTERARQQVVEKTREERVSTLIREFEEKNAHTLNNIGGDKHVVGLYRWVNKSYKAQVVNYGKRLMVEFLVPEPGAFHLHAMAESPIEDGLRLEQPIDPRSDEAGDLFLRPPIRKFTDMTTTNYAFWSSLYGADVEPPPVYWVQTSKAFGREGMDHRVQFSAPSNEVTVPDGYEAAKARWSWGLHSENHDGGNNWLTIMVGQQSTYNTQGGNSGWRTLYGEDDIVPVSIMGRTRMYAVNVEVECRRTTAHYDAWRQKTFAAIIAAYENKLAAYNNALAEAQARAGVTIRGTNPALNRNIEQLELKKGSIRLMTRCVPTWSNAMKDGTPENCNYPEFECCEAIDDGAYVQYVEQAFEWSLMTYLFYPYFWGRKCNWETLYRMDDADPLFLAFLQAGYARVVVPVREGYEKSVMRFLVDGIPWSGGEVPGIDSEMFLSIVNEMQEPVGEPDPNIEPWIIELPTALTALQCESGCIPGEGLPCPGGDAELGAGEGGILGNGDNGAPENEEDPEPEHDHG